MVVLLLLILFLIFFKSKIHIKDFNCDYISSKNSAYIKGIFTIFVFYRHCHTYIVLNSIVDYPMILVDRLLLQNLVAMFFFYSGYGIYERIKEKGYNYIKSFPKKRLLAIFINFAIVIISFLIMDIILGRINDYSIKTILLSFIGWESVGNSNWYIFVVFLQYIFLIISFNIFKKSNKKAIFSMIIMNGLYCVIVLFFKPQHWMNTSFCFISGMIYSYNKERIENFLMKNKNYLITGTLGLIVFVGLMYILLTYKVSICTVILSQLFLLLIVLFTMKIEINSKILYSLGSNVFWIYTLQRIPMIVLKVNGLDKYPYVYFVICFIITILLATIYEKVFNKIVNNLINKNTKKEK